VKVSLLIALFVAAASIAAKAETTQIAYHKEFGVVSAPTAVAAVRSAGLDPATLPVRIGSTYVMRAVDRRGMKVRVVLAANTGEIIAVHAAAAKQDDVNKSLGNSRAQPKLASSSATTAPALSGTRRRLSAPVSSRPMQILPQVAIFQHKIVTAAHPVSLAVAPPVRVAANERVQPQIPATLLGSLRSAGLTPATAPVKVEPTYVVQAVNQRGMTLRVLLAANSGDILAIQPTRGALRHERRDGETSSATDSRSPGTVAPMDPYHKGAHPSSSEPSFIAP